MPERHPAVDLDVALDFMHNAIVQNGPWTFCAMHPEKGHGQPHTQTFTSREHAKAWLDKYVDTHNLYYLPNGLAPGVRTSHKPSKDEIGIIRFQQDDIDRTPDGKRLTPEARKEWVRKLKAGDVVGVPTVIVPSGNGLQVLYRLATPIDNQNWEASGTTLAEFEGIGRTLAKEHGWDHCFAINHVFRLPGTMNYANEAKRRDGLVDVPVGKPIFINNANKFDIWQFPYDEKNVEKSVEVQIGGPVMYANIDALLADYALDDSLVNIIVHGEDPNRPKPGERPGSDKWEYEGVKRLLNLDVPPEVVFGVLMNPDFLISTRTFEQKDGRTPEHHAELTVTNAVKRMLKEQMEQLAEFEDSLPQEEQTEWDAGTDPFNEVVRITEAMEKAKPGSTLKFRLWKPSEVAELPRPKWLVKNYMLQNSTGCLYGPSGEGKTFVALDLMLCIAMGIEFYGNKVTRGRVLYLAAENDKALVGDRVKAWCVKHGFKMSDLDGHFFLEFTAMDLASDADTSLFINQVRTQEGCDFAAICLDTLNMNMVGEESKQEVMNIVFKNVARVRKALRTGVLFVHHTGKDGLDYRGSSVIKATVDYMLRFGLWEPPKAQQSNSRSKDKKAIPAGVMADLRVLHSDKARESKKAGDLLLYFDTFNIGYDEDGDEITTRFFIQITDLGELLVPGHQNDDGEGSESTEVPDEEAEAVIGPAQPFTRANLVRMIVERKPRSIAAIGRMSKGWAGWSDKSLQREIKEMRKDGLVHKSKLQLAQKGAELYANEAGEALLKNG